MCLHVCVCKYLHCACLCACVQLASPHPCTQCLPVLPSDSSKISHGASSITSSASSRPLMVGPGSVLELTAPIIPQQTQPYKLVGLFWIQSALAETFLLYFLIWILFFLHCRLCLCSWFRISRGGLGIDYDLLSP